MVGSWEKVCRRRLPADRKILQFKHGRSGPAGYACFSLYRIKVRAKRFYLRIFFHFLDIAVANSWLLYSCQATQLGQKKTQTLLNFKLDVAFALIEAYKHQDRKRGRPSKTSDSETGTPPSAKKTLPGRLPVSDVRYDCIAHWPLHTENKQRCKKCIKNYSRTACQKCMVYLCLNKDRNCFLDLHTKK